MCIRLKLLLFLQGELHRMRLENLKVRYELSKFGYYRTEKQLKLLNVSLTVHHEFTILKIPT